MQKSNYTVEVLINGRPIKEYAHQGRVYIEGKEGSTFSLRLRNNSWQRKLFIPSVDGLSVMDGEDAANDSGGYIVGAHSSITIDGWRLSDKEVAEFYFTTPGDSYRKRSNKGSNVGVIGCLVFDEYTPPPVYRDTSMRGDYIGNGSSINFLSASSASASFTSMTTTDSFVPASAKAVSNDLGTGWGKEKRSEVISVAFERSGSPEILEIYYNTREQLEKLGVPMREAVYVAPQSFPGNYCKPPKN